MFKPLLVFVLWALFLTLVFRAIGRFIRGISDGASGRPAPDRGRGTGRSAPAAPVKGELMARDPVCGTFVVQSRALSAKGEFFCSDKCRQEYVSR